MKAAKGWIAGVVAVLTAVQPLVKNTMQTYDWFVLGAGILGAIGVYFTPNKPSNTRDDTLRRNY